MATVRSYSVALNGLRGTVIEVEVHLANSLPGMVVIGLPDAALNEARERVRSAAANSGCPLPARKITVNLSPAELPKHGSAFDLAIALTALGCEGKLRADSLARVVHLGELGLDGRVRPVRGVLPAVLAAARAGYSTVMVPEANQAEAELVPGVEVIAVSSLRQAAIWHGGPYQAPSDAAPTPNSAPMQSSAPTQNRAPTLSTVPTLSSGPMQSSDAVLETADASQAPEPDLADVAGNPEAAEALLAAAVGGHHLLMIGPPGAGKTMLAERLPALLPDLDAEASLEASCLRSLAQEHPLSNLVIRPPFEAPHHTITSAAMVGGGSGQLRPGAVARACHGVLFLDEATEFPRSVLDALRQPLERGVVTIQRARAVAEFPARFQLVMAANPCPCGNYGGQDECVCAPTMRRRYLGRLSGPLLDRIDLQLRLRRVSLAQLRLAQDAPTMTTAEARTLVVTARQLSHRRLKNTPWRRNADVPGQWLRGEARLPGASTAVLDGALDRGSLTLRGYDRVLRVAWSLADLEGKPRPERTEIGRALYLRSGVHT